MSNQLDENEMLEMYEWVDSFTLSNPKKIISREFSDGVLYAEIIKKNIPNLVQLVNYVPTMNNEQKKINWNTLNKKVLSKLGFQISKSDIEGIIQCKSFLIEKVLIKLYKKIKEYKDKMQSKNMIGMINSFKNEEEDIVEPYLTKEMFYKNEIDIKDREIERLKELIKKAENTLTQLYDEKVSLLSQKNTLKNMVLDYTNRGNNGSTTNMIK